MKTEERNDLVAEFTAWLNTLAYRTKMNFIRREIRHNNNISFDEIVVKNYVCYQSNEKFSFENNLLEKAFNLLSDSHRRVLEMLYFERKTPAQIALEMNCTKQNVYNQKSRAIKFMRGYMGKLDE